MVLDLQPTHPRGGEFKFTERGEGEDFKVTQPNRDEFVKEYGITNYANNISYYNELRLGLWSDDYLNGILDKQNYAPNKYNYNIYGDLEHMLDHIRDFKSINKIIRVISPYGNITDEKLEIYKKNGYIPYKKLYITNANTFIKIIYTD